MRCPRVPRSPPRREGFLRSAPRSSLSGILGREVEFMRRTEIPDRHDVAHHSHTIAVDMERESRRLERPSRRLAFTQIEHNLMRGAGCDEADRARPAYDDRAVVVTRRDPLDLGMPRDQLGK